VFEKGHFWYFAKVMTVLSKSLLIIATLSRKRTYNNTHLQHS